jgi:prepilin-type N-terminal cleavage/methylation domain-containing protein/prepilin-type processing-associated H-X9-DG protein
MRKSPYSAAGRRSGFTLVELLIVILIIAMLIAMLIPAVMSALQVAKTLTCKSQLGQIALAVNGYIGDYKGAILPTAIVSSTGTIYWCNLLAQRGIACENTVSLQATVKTQQDSPFICPITNDLGITDTFSSQSTPQDQTPPSPTNNGWFRLGNATIATDCTYYWNGYTGSNSDQMKYYPSLVFDTTVTNSTQRLLMIHDISEIRQRSTMAMVMDGNFWQSTDAPILAKIAMRHSGGTYGSFSQTNIAYYDGHVDTLDRYSPSPIPTGWASGTEDDPDNPNPPMIPIKSTRRTGWQTSIGATATKVPSSLGPIDGGPPWFLLDQPR